MLHFLLVTLVTLSSTSSFAQIFDPKVEMQKVEKQLINFEAQLEKSGNSTLLLNWKTVDQFSSICGMELVGYKIVSSINNSIGLLEFTLKRGLYPICLSSLGSEKGIIELSVGSSLPHIQKSGNYIVKINGKNVGQLKIELEKILNTNPEALTIYNTSIKSFQFNTPQTPIAQ